ncbi:hypothetical protein AQ810_17065 [Burkholderia pseudomallei]|nr:hypothetical protein AQ810_17065 [Burkholderia pseudomallei]
MTNPTQNINTRDVRNPPVKYKEIRYRILQVTNYVTAFAKTQDIVTIGLKDYSDHFRLLRLIF